MVTGMEWCWLVSDWLTALGVAHSREGFMIQGRTGTGKAR